MSNRGRKPMSEEEKSRQLQAKKNLSILLKEIKDERGITQSELVRMMYGMPRDTPGKSERYLGMITDLSDVQALNQMKNPNSSRSFTVDRAQKICEAVNGHSVWDGIYEPTDYRWQWLAALDDKKHPDTPELMNIDELMKDDDLWLQACLADPESDLIEHYVFLLMNSIMASREGFFFGQRMERDTLERTTVCTAYTAHSVDNPRGPVFFTMEVQEKNALVDEIESFIEFKIGELIKKHEKEIIPFD